MKKLFKFLCYKVLTWSLIVSNKLRKENQLKSQLEKILPDLSQQYTTFTIDMNDNYLVTKLRCQHCFQVSICLKAISLLGKENNITLVDIGDSSGTHLIYIKEVLKEKAIKTLSVNLDPISVQKIQAKGLDALLCKAEELHLEQEGKFKADIFLSYEMLEHLLNPIGFLHEMAMKSHCEYFAMTVPFVHKSKVALNLVRYNEKGTYHAETVHIFEFSPDDWDVIFKFTGWEIIYKDKYAQYPTIFPISLIKFLWRKVDFDGFYGVILKKNNQYSKMYLDW